MLLQELLTNTPCWDMYDTTFDKVSLLASHV